MIQLRDYITITKKLETLQAYEAEGKLPRTDQITWGKQLNEKEKLLMADLLGASVGYNGNIEALDFLIEGEYIINYGLMSIYASIVGNVSFLEAIYDNFESGRCLLSIDYLIENEPKNAKYTNKAREWINNRKKELDTVLEEQRKRVKDLNDKYNIIFNDEDWYCKYSGWHYAN